MDRQTFTNTLNQVLDEDILAGLKRFAAKRIDYFNQQIRLLSALDEKDDEHILREGMPSIISNLSKNLEDSEHKNVALFYITALHEVADSFPAEVVWPQQGKRFVSEYTDSWMLSLKKSGKRLGWSLSQGWYQLKKISNSIVGRQVEQKPVWMQQIPLQRVIKYHGAETDFVADYIRQVEALQLHFIIEMEKFLVVQGNSREQGRKSMDLSVLINSLQQKTTNLDGQLQHQLANGIATLKTEIFGQVEKTGTVERKKSYYATSRVEMQLKNIRNALFKLEKKWKETQQVLLERTKNILAFLKIWSDIRKNKTVFLKDLKLQFQNYLYGPLEKLRLLLKESVLQTADADRGNSYQEIEEIKDRLASCVHNDLHEPLQQLQKEHILSAKTEHFAETLLRKINQAPENLPFVFDLNGKVSPPVVHKKQIEWKLLLVRAFREQVINKIKPSEQKYEELVSDALNQVEEIEDIVEINLESVLQGFTDDELKADEDQNPLQITNESLERISEKTEDLISDVKQKYKDIDGAVEERLQHFFESIITLLDTTDSKNLQLFITKYRVKETTGDWQQAVDTRFQKSREKALLLYRFARKKTNRYIENAKKFLGILEEVIEKSKRADITTYLSETDQKIKELPYIYRRLFNFDELADERFYVTVTDSASTFKKAYKQWQESFAATFAVVGEKGSGKSTFLQLMAEELFTDADMPFTQLNMENTIWTEQALATFLCDALSMDRKSSIADIIEGLRGKAQKQVIVLESIQNCFVRNINGYEAIEKLCYLISETKEDVFWVVSCSRYGWQFLDKTQTLSEYFSHIIRTDKLDLAGLEKAIMNRHRSSGYTLQFEAKSDAQPVGKSEKLTEEEQQSDRREKYFEKLEEVAEGNISIAMTFWIRSIDKFDDRCFYIKPLEVTSLEIVDDLRPQILFVLAAFILHDSISDQDLAMILNLNCQESRLLLNRLYSMGLLQKKENYYILNHLMYRQIVRVLKDRNIIHLV